MPQDLVFITGATGFIGAETVRDILTAGYRVRLSVRKESQTSGLKDLFAAHVDKIDFVVVPDITTPGAFDSTLDGVTYVIHAASPMPGKGQDVRKDYVDPAVLGTESILKSASRKPDIKRVGT
jgi:nucleoside-diphosphate-sugar epimerase